MRRTVVLAPSVNQNRRPSPAFAAAGSALIVAAACGTSVPVSLPDAIDHVASPEALSLQAAVEVIDALTAERPHADIATLGAWLDDKIFELLTWKGTRYDPCFGLPASGFAADWTSGDIDISLADCTLGSTDGLTLAGALGLVWSGAGEERTIAGQTSRDGVVFAVQAPWSTSSSKWLPNGLIRATHLARRSRSGFRDPSGQVRPVRSCQARARRRSRVFWAIWKSTRSRLHRGSSKRLSASVISLVT